MIFNCERNHEEVKKMALTRLNMNALYEKTLGQLKTGLKCLLQICLVVSKAKCESVPFWLRHFSHPFSCAGCDRSGPGSVQLSSVAQLEEERRQKRR